MSKFNIYAKEADEIASAAFKAYREAETAYQKAVKKVKQFPQRYGIVNAEYAVQSTRAQVEYLEAKQVYESAQEALSARINELKAIREKLAAAIENAYSVDPSKLDTATLELLKSGVLTPNEFSRLMKDAQAMDNPTMIRLIGKYADEAAAKIGVDQSNESSRILRMVSYQSRQNTGSERLQAFDNMVDLYGHCARTPSLIDRWSEFTADTVKNF